MAQKRIMLLGAAGQIGQAIQHQPLPEDWTLGAYSRADCDITDRYAVRQALQTFKPDLILNAAAMTDVDPCETDKERAMATNFEAPSILAAQCSAIDVPIIHLSTDYVFDGKDGEIPYRTDSPMNPLNVYAQSKMLGEEAIRHTHPWHVILRVSWVFSAYSNNLLTKMLQKIETGEVIQSVTDQKGCPTHAPEIAKALITMSDAILRGKVNGFGTFHLSGAQAVTRFDFTQAIMKAYEPYTKQRPPIHPALTTDFPEFAPRPAYSALDCSRILDLYGIKQQDLHEGLDEALRDIFQNKGTTA